MVIEDGNLNGHFFVFSPTKMHVSLTVYANIWTTTSEFNNRSFLQGIVAQYSLQLPVPSANILLERQHLLCMPSQLLVQLVMTIEGRSHNF